MTAYLGGRFSVTMAGGTDEKRRAYCAEKGHSAADAKGRCLCCGALPASTLPTTYAPAQAVNVAEVGGVDRLTADLGAQLRRELPVFRVDGLFDDDATIALVDAIDAAAPGQPVARLRIGRRTLAGMYPREMEPAVE